MKYKAIAAACMLAGITACSEQAEVQPVVPEVQGDIIVDGAWITEADGSVMSDPQTSGLTPWRGQLVSLSDGSAQEDQQRRLHFINPNNAQLTPKPAEMTMSASVRRSCFSQYLADEPDLEALVVDPRDDSVFYVVTEDATRTGALSERCQKKYQDTGSTDYPTLLVKVVLSENGQTQMQNVRPLQFDLDYKVGDFPNDGIEGLAMSPDGTLYLGLEKDTAGNPRIFTLDIDDGFWQSSDFAPVADPQLNTPTFDGGNHPVNALAYYVDEDSENAFLLAAARNDNQLWVIDIEGKRPTKKIPLQFTAPNAVTDGSCPDKEIMDNASIEGMAVLGDTLWLVNDPWKVNYMKNVQCEVNRANYEANAPLLFPLKLNPAWFN